jgi:tetratricopeptide (TPR) repeat protein
VTAGFLVVILLATSPPATVEQPADERPAIDRTTEARSLSDEGMTRFKEGEYDLAIAAFQRSYDLAPAPALLFDLGQAYRRKGNCAEAAAQFRRFALLDPGAAQRSSVTARIEEMDACVRAGKAAVSVPAAPPTATTVATSARRMGPPMAKDPPGPVTTMVCTPVATSRYEAGKVSRVAGLAIAGSGIMAVAVGVYASLQVAADQDRVSALFHSGGMWNPAWDGLVAHGQRYETLSKVLYTSGGLALGTGLVLYYLGARGRSVGNLSALAVPGAAAIRWRQSF